MSAQAYTWGGDGPASGGRRPPGTVVEGPWPAVEEIWGEFEHAVIIDRARLGAAAPVREVQDRSVAGTDRAFSRGQIPEWVWSTVAAAVMGLMATGVAVAVWRLSQVWQGQLA